MDSGGGTATGSGRALYGLTVLAGAVLVFQVQPIAGRFLLPAFGGGAAVWTACMFFFQLMLLAGYAYAHVLATRLAPRHQALLHATLLVLSLPFLPLTFAVDGDAAGHPGPRIWLTLLVSMGVPFVLLAGTAPLMQRWFALTEPARSPYRLYALSNAGALLALLSYPILIEPRLALASQTLAWSAGYGVFVVASLGACRLVRRRYRRVVGHDVPAEHGRYPPADAASTIALAAAGVVMLLAVTNQLTQNVAPVPFLWVLPLVVYLLSYVICFSGERAYDRPIWGSLFVVAATSLILLEFFGVSFGIVTVIAAYLLVLFCVCIVCHGELYRLRPAPARLSAYYLWIAGGGALGGALVSVVAPLVFDRYWEALAGVYLVFVAFGLLVLREYRRARKRGRAEPESQAFVERWARRTFTVGWGIGIVLFPVVVGLVYGLLPQRDVAASRNFYGILNVRDATAEAPPRRVLVDGTTIHGFQLLDEDRRAVPTSYYAADTGIGLVMRDAARDETGLDVGVVGLGTGTLAAYGRPGDRFRFYELNPDVVAMAEGHFTFLADSAAATDIVSGDARVSMERELARGGGRGYDVLVVDAFSSGAIPVHLLTREAHELYWRHLEEDGVLAFHVTNNYLDLVPVVADAGSALGKRATLVRTEAADGVTTSADWVLLHAGDELVRGDLPDSAVAAPLLPALSARVWTDDYSNLLGAIRD